MYLIFTVILNNLIFIQLHVFLNFSFFLKDFKILKIKKHHYIEKMGFVFSKIFGSLFSSEEVRLLILGLDNAGKTTILCNYF